MLIVCPNCKKRFEVDPAKAEEGKKFRCSSCRAVFRLRKNPEAVASAPSPAAAESAPQGGQPASFQPQQQAQPQPAPAQPRVEPPPEPQLPLSAQPQQGHPRPQGGALKVVVANESAPFCEAVRKVLASEPFEVVLCNDGKVALETVERMRPEVLLLDVALPTMFGFEVCERVRQNRELSQVKIVLIASIYDKTRYKRSPNSLYGADDYIEKHHIPDSLVPMIYRLTSGAAPSAELPSPDELATQEETRSQIREAEVRETTAPGSAELPSGALDLPQESFPMEENRFSNLPADPFEAPAGSAFGSGEAEMVALQEIIPVEEPLEAPPQPIPAPKPPELSDAEVKARRLARIIVSDIVLYNQGKVEQGVREGSFYDLLADDIREGERLYLQRVPEQVRERSNFLAEAFEDLIAKKRAELRI